MIEIGENGLGWSREEVGGTPASVLGHAIGGIGGVERGGPISLLDFIGGGHLATALVGQRD